MKQILIFIGFIFVMSGCKTAISEDSSEAGLSFKTTLTGYIKEPHETPGFSYLMINAKLVNTTNKTYEFVVYNCATVANLVTEPTFIKPLTYECSRNYPIIISLKPGQELTMPVILECPVAARSVGSRLKTGFIIVGPEAIKHDADLFTILSEKRKKCEDVLWSEPINLESGNGEAFETGSF